MSGFDERQKAFETKYAHEEKVGFDVEARCSKIYGLWAAEKLGLEDEDNKNTYAMSVVESNLEEPGFDDVLRKVRGDFEEKGVEFTEEELNLELDKALQIAREQIAEEN